MFSSLGLGFAGIGKQSALKIFDSSSKLIEHLGEHSPPEESILADAEAFVCQLYNHGTDRIDINKERAAAFCKVKKNLDSLPPTKDALHLHIRHAKFQCIIWKKAKELPMCGFIAQLVEHRTGIAEVTGSNPVEALIFFQASSFQLLKLENSLR